MFEQNPSVILIAILAVVKGSGNASKTRGVICLIIGYAALFIMDSDSSVELNHSMRFFESAIFCLFHFYKIVFAKKNPY